MIRFLGAGGGLGWVWVCSVCSGLAMLNDEVSTEEWRALFRGRAITEVQLWEGLRSERSVVSGCEQLAGRRVERFDDAIGADAQHIAASAFVAIRFRSEEAAR